MVTFKDAKDAVRAVIKTLNPVSVNSRIHKINTKKKFVLKMQMITV